VNAILQFVLKHGYAFLFAGTFAHQVGIPIPGPLILVCAGALTATGKLGVLPAMGITVVACVLADWIWFEAGRRRGDKVLHFLHRLTTRDPDFHDRRAKRVFARYGLPLLLVSKFVPGLDAIAPPLAGTSRTSRVRFLAFDAVGASLYTCAYGGLGYAFSHDLDRAAAYVSRAGGFFLGLALVGIFTYVAYKLLRRALSFRKSQLQRVPPVDPVECVHPIGMP
jgi:membrane protein DedA with SNARE-associated domain